MSYTHLSIVERSKLEILHQQGKSARVIAQELGRHHATISRELRRNAQQKSYQAERSQEDYCQRRAASVPNGKWMPDRTARSMEIAFGAVASPYPTGVFQTATTDRGKDFACYAKRRLHMGFRSTLLTLIHPGNAARVKTPMDSSLSSFLTEPISHK